jgi:hypothetical protein
VRELAIAIRGPAFGWLLLGATLVAYAQGTLDLRIPAERSGARGPTCGMCGEIRSIREVATQGSAPVAPVNPARSTAAYGNDWAVVGAAVYTPIGRGSDTDWQVGAVGTNEMAERFGSSTYEIEVRMDTGERKVLRRRDGPRFAVGDRVTVSETMMEKL